MSALQRIGGGLALPALWVVVAVLAASGRAVAAALWLGTALWLLCLRSAEKRSAVLVLIVAALIRLPFLWSDFHSNDLSRYLWEGRVQWEGVSPYATAPDDPDLAHLRDETDEPILHPELPTVYPPLAQAVFLAAAAAGLDEIGLRNAILVLDLAVVVALLGWLLATRRPPGWALLYAWAPVVVAGAAAGHIDALMLLFLVGSAWAWERGHHARAAAALAGAILAKTAAVVVVPWLLLRRPRLVLGVTAPLVALGYAPYLGGGNLLGSLGTFATEFTFNASVFRILDWAAPSLAPIAAAGLLLAWLAWVAASQPRVANACALSLAGLLVLSPTVHYWYLAWFLAGLAGVGPRAWTWPLVAWAAAILFTLPAYLGFVRGEAVDVTSLATIAEYALPAGVALWLAYRHRPRRADAGYEAGEVLGQVCVVVPSRREVVNLAELLPRWLEAGVDRVIVADLPTGDGTEKLCRRLPRVSYLPVFRLGYGAAVRAGLSAAGDADFAVVCDADHLRGPAQLRELLAPFTDPRVGLVTAARTRGSPLTLLQRLGNALTTFLIALGWGRWFHDLGPFRALRMSEWKTLPDDPEFGWNVEMNVRALERGMKVAEVPLASGPRVHGASLITGTLTGSFAAGVGMLARLYRLREAS